MGKMPGQLLPEGANALADSVREFLLTKGVPHLPADIVPEILAHFLVDALISVDQEFTVGSDKQQEDAVALLGLFQSELPEEPAPYV